MRYLVLILIFAFVGCGEDKPTQNDDNKILDEEKYTIDELEQNPDWVEVNDIDTLEDVCIWSTIYKMGEICRDLDDYEKLYRESKNFEDHSKLVFCEKDTNYIDVNFNNKSILLFSVHIGGGSPEIERKIFKNDKIKEIRYAVEIMFTDVTKENSGYSDKISVPRIENEYRVHFDTLETYYYPG